MREVSTFLPDWTSAPGDTIADLLEERRWSQQDLATRAGFTAEQVGSLVRGGVEISNETAKHLSIALGSTTEFWLAREAGYRAGLVRQRQSESQRAESNS